MRKGNLLKESKGRVTIELLTDQGMWPTFNIGDFLVIDPNDRNFDDSPFVIDWPSKFEPFTIRRVMLHEDGSYDLRGDDVYIKRQHLKPEENLPIIGKVIGLYRKL
jgi:phage repressor protein C with HTH and peptisase S24 domain